MTRAAQLPLPGIEDTEVYVCPLCSRPARLFGQFSPLFPWCVCRECSIKYPYPVELFVLSTRRNQDRHPLMIDPSPEKSDLRDLRVQLDEMLRCALDPSRQERPVVKYNLSGLELYNPVRRSRRQQFQRWSAAASLSLTYRQVSLPVCDRCGCVHDRAYELLPGHFDYWSKCQQCADEESVEALWRHRGIFGDDDDESILDRIYRSHPELFERGVLPDYWLKLRQAQRSE